MGAANPFPIPEGRRLRDRTRRKMGYPTPPKREGEQRDIIWDEKKGEGNPINLF